MNWKLIVAALIPPVVGGLIVLKPTIAAGIGVALLVLLVWFLFSAAIYMFFLTVSNDED